MRKGWLQVFEMATEGGDDDDDDDDDDEIVPSYGQRVLCRLDWRSFALV